MKTLKGSLNQIDYDANVSQWYIEQQGGEIQVKASQESMASSRSPLALATEIDDDISVMEKYMRKAKSVESIVKQFAPPMPPSQKSVDDLAAMTNRRQGSIVNVDNIFDALKVKPPTMPRSVNSTNTLQSRQSIVMTPQTLQTIELSEIMLRALKDLQKEIAKAQSLLKPVLLQSQTQQFPRIPNGMSKSPSTSSDSAKSELDVVDVKQLDACLRHMQKIVVSAAIRHSELSLQMQYKGSSEVTTGRAKILLTEGYKAEFSFNNQMQNEAYYVSIDEPIEHIKSADCPFKKRLSQRDYSVYAGCDLQSQDPFVLIISRDNRNAMNFFDALLWITEESLTCRFLLPIRAEQQPKPEQLAELALKAFKNDIKVVLQSLNRQNEPEEKYANVSMQLVDSKSILDQLLQFEKSKEQSYKMGVLYAGAGQTTEEEMFNNQVGSARHQEFLNLLGKTVDLKGYTGFRGGLDVKNDTTGTKSLIKNWRGIEIMFHVSTMLPSGEIEMLKNARRKSQFNREQQLGKKRHIGNDICLILFIDGDTPYAADTITSHFTHVFAIVRPIIEHNASEVKGYQLTLIMKDGVPQCTPMLKSSTYVKSEAFTDLLVCKLINAQNMALRAPEFASKIQRTRKTMLNDIVQSFAKEKKFQLNLLSEPLKLTKWDSFRRVLGSAQDQSPQSAKSKSKLAK